MGSQRTATIGAANCCLEPVMSKFRLFLALFAVSLISVAAERAQADETAPNSSTAPPSPPSAPLTRRAPGRYPPPPGPAGYAQPWQPAPHYWSEQPWGYGQLTPPYPPGGQYPAIPAAPAPAGQPLSVEFRQAQEQLAQRNAELDKARATLEQLRDRLQRSLEAQQALNERMATMTGEQQALLQRAAELSAELSSATATLQQQRQQIANDQQHTGTLTAERDRLRADLADRDTQLTTVQTRLQAATEALQQAKVGAATPEPADTVEPAADAAAEVRAVEIAALHTAAADTDGDGVPDTRDLCPQTQQGTAVEATGCADGAAIDLEGVDFAYDSHELTGKAQGILAGVVAVLRQHPDLRLQVAGHTDTQGDPAYNQWLSLQRAQAVRDYLVAQGVDPAHIGAVGYGGQRPIAANTTREGLRMNRRVELRSLR
jgi:outer membrane protein OmpA-like peptidoglycan-associated protein